MLFSPLPPRPARRAPRWTLLAAALTSVLALTACGAGGDDTTPSGQATILDVAAPPLVKSPNQGMAKLGTLVGATVEVMDLHSDTPFYTTSSDAQGRFKLDLGTHPLTELYRVRVSGGTDVDFSDTGAAGQAPVANTAVLTALATGKQIAENGVSVTVLSDLLARRVGDTATWNPTALVMRELDNAAQSLVETDINGDGVIDYLDILGFNPGNAVHKDSLTFDYADLFIKNPDGKSVMDLYHANDPALNGEIDVVMSDLIDFRLPDADEATLAALSFGVEGHGTLQTASVTATIDHENGRYLQAVDKSTTQRLQVRATPATGGKLLGWEGCEQDATDPLLCRVTPDTSKSVIAIFKDVDVVAAGTSVVHLPGSGGTIGLVLQQDRAVVTAMAADPVVGQLDAALAQLAANPAWQIYIGGDRAKAATLHITSFKERMVLDGVVRYAFGYEDAPVTDALTAGSAYAPPAAISVDTISAVEYAEDPNAAPTTILPQNEANSDYVAGPNPVDAAIDTQLCGSNRSQHLLVDGNVACIANSNLPVQSETGLTHDCAATEALVESLDGEEYCVAPADVHARATVRALSTRVRAQSVAPGRVQAAAAAALAVLEQPVQTSASTVTFKPGQVAWLVGQGKAIYLAHNVFMVDRSDGRGITLVTVDGAVESVPVASTRALAYQQCSNDIAAPECRFFGRNQAAYMNKQGDGRVSSKLALLPVPIVWEFSPESAPWIKFKLKPQVDLTGTASANFDFGAVYYAFSSRGNIEVTPSLTTSISADGVAIFEKPTAFSPPTERKEGEKAKMLKSGEPIFEKSLFKIDFIEKIPGANTVSPVLESKLELSIGLDGSGNAKIEIVTDYKQVVAWDVRSEFTYRVVGANHNVQSFKVGSKGFPGATVKGEFNASLGLFAKAEVSMGVRLMLEDVASIEAKYYPFKVEALGKALLSYQTDPVKLAAQNGQNFCWAGAVSMTVKESFEVNAKFELKPKDKALKEILKYFDFTKKKEFPLFNKDRVKWAIGSKIGEFAKDPNAGADTDVTADGEQNDNLQSDTKLACAKPSPDKMPAERSYSAGHLELDGGGSVFTKTHELTMQPDGNLVIYAWNGSRGAVKWASNTQNKGVYNRAKFQADGNLLVVDMLETVNFSSGSHDIGGKSIRFAERGALEVLTADGTSVWSSDGGINAALPEAKEFAPGQLTLGRGDSVLTRARVLVMQPDGNLVLYRVKDGRTDGAVWASGTNDGTRAAFQADGNLVVYRADGTAAWDAGTSGKGATRLAFQADGNLVIYRNTDALWARGK